jgi:uncharacterized membrane protein YfcA
VNTAALLFGAGLLAGAMNAVAGGGSFVSFPALVFAGLPPVAANASSTVALFPGALTSIWAFRHDLVRIGEVPLGAMLAVSVAGGLTGAVLLLVTSDAMFRVVVPWLLLLASLAFAFGRPVGAALRRRFRIGAPVVLSVQFLLAIYGGYFGGAVGIMMMAVWGLLSNAELKVMNPAKVLLVGAMNAVAVISFIVAGVVWWPETLVMLAAAALGGYAGATLGRRLPPAVVRWGITGFSFAMTLVFFRRAGWL